MTLGPKARPTMAPKAVSIPLRLLSVEAALLLIRNSPLEWSFRNFAVAICVASAHPLLLHSAPRPARRKAMLYVVQFEDKPGTGELREKLLEAHFAFLDSKRDQVLVAGSLREEPGDRPVGGLWIVEARDADAVRDIFSDDPFWTNGLRASVRINRWHKAFQD